MSQNCYGIDWANFHALTLLLATDIGSIYLFQIVIFLSVKDEQLQFYGLELR